MKLTLIKDFQQCNTPNRISILTNNQQFNLSFNSLQYLNSIISPPRIFKISKQTSRNHRQTLYHHKFKISSNSISLNKPFKEAQANLNSLSSSPKVKHLNITRQCWSNGQTRMRMRFCPVSIAGWEGHSGGKSQRTK